MQLLLRGRWWLAGLLLIVSCRSNQAAFSFRTATLPTSSAPTASPVVLMAAAPATTTGSAANPPAVIALAAAAPTAVKARPAPRPLKRAAIKARKLTLIRAGRPEAATRAAHPDGLHWVLGGALVVAGVVTGILLGGWLGLGVGAALVLLGYYFVLMGLGGRQAWLEVFQEFFNM